MVLKNQNDFRAEVLSLKNPVNNRPAAIYVLRSYLRICLPFTIETSINTTLQTYVSGGAPALDIASANPLVSPANVPPSTSGSAAPGGPSGKTSPPAVPHPDDATLQANCAGIKLRQTIIQEAAAGAMSEGTAATVQKAKDKIAALMKANGDRKCSEVGL